MVTCWTSKFPLRRRTHIFDPPALKPASPRGAQEPASPARRQFARITKRTQSGAGGGGRPVQAGSDLCGQTHIIDSKILKLTSSPRRLQADAVANNELRNEPGMSAIRSSPTMKTALLWMFCRQDAGVLRRRRRLPHRVWFSDEVIQKSDRGLVLDG